MSITYRQADDLMVERYGDRHDAGDEWWSDLVDMLMRYPSVKALRADQPDWRVPQWWPGAAPVEQS